MTSFRRIDVGRSICHADTFSTIAQQRQRTHHSCTGFIDALDTGPDHLGLASYLLHVLRAVSKAVGGAVE
jgi:hypothetical protein